MRVRQEMIRRLRSALEPALLELIDESERHRGHAGARPEGESHFRLRVVSSAFVGRTRIARQRMVFDALGDLIRTDVHALAMTTLTPDEAHREGHAADPAKGDEPQA